MEAVADVRRRTGNTKATRAKTGHAGTLDPLATGILVIALGRATKQLGAFMDLAKTYRAEVDLSAFTPTDDLESEREDVTIDTPPTEHEVREALAPFIGPITQRPSAHSAVKIDGQRAYKLARRGEAVEMPERQVTVHELELVRYDWPIVDVRMVSSKGLYVRTFARDLGVAMGTGGHLQSLRRTAIGPFTDAMAREPVDLPDWIEQSDLIAVDEAMRMASEWTQTHQPVEGGSG